MRKRMVWEVANCRDSRAGGLSSTKIVATGSKEVTKHGQCEHYESFRDSVTDMVAEPPMRRVTYFLLTSDHYPQTL